MIGDPQFTINDWQMRGGWAPLTAVLGTSELVPRQDLDSSDNG